MDRIKLKVLEINLYQESDVVWLEAPGILRFLKEEIPPLSHNEMLCRTLLTAISPGTELAAYKGLPPLRSGQQYPRLLGYCNVSEIIDIDSSVTEFKIGDRILSFNSHRTKFKVKIDEVLYRLKSNDVNEEVVCAYLFHLGYDSILRVNTKPGSKVLVIGLGVLGLTTVRMNSLAGALVSAITDHSDSKKIAYQLNAENVMTREEFDLLNKKNVNGYFDIVVVTSNSWSDWRRALESTIPRGVIAVLGFPGRGDKLLDFNPLDPKYFYSKQLRIEAIGLSAERNDGRGFLRYNERDNLEYIINQITKGNIDTKLIAPISMNYVEIEQAYGILDSPYGHPPTILLNWGDR
jgi:threonine dehydrogenase-like Zn-dependent dehydrogenase